MSEIAPAVLRGEFKGKRYNPPQRMICYKRMLVLALALLWLAPAYGATSWDGPAAELARQIAAISGPGPARLAVVNRSTIATNEIPAIRRALEQDLRGYGVIVANGEAPTGIRVTLSQNTQHGLWVAEIQEGNETRVGMISVDIPAGIASQSGSNLILHKTLLFAQSSPILDVGFVVVGSERRMLILESEKLTSYRTESGIWKKDQSFDISHSQPFSRDTRGRILPASGHLFDVHLPGVLCSGTENEGRLALSCGESDDPWPMTSSQKSFYNPTRNFFTGVLVPDYGAEVGPFYSAAELVRPRGMATVFTRVNGDVVFTDGSAIRPVAGARDWGSDIAAVRSGCGGGGQLLVSDAGATAVDSLRAYELPEREVMPVSPPMPFDGMVTAMWPTADGDAAMVVIRKQQSSQYEAYSVSVSCD